MRAYVEVPDVFSSQKLQQAAAAFLASNRGSMTGRYSPSEERNEHGFRKRSPVHVSEDLFGDTDTEDSFEHRYHGTKASYDSHNLTSSSDEYACDHHGSHHPQQQFKCRQLPCRTFISTGSCPFGDRCVFLHDPCIVAKPVYIKTKRKSKDDSTTDNFFWPTMSLNSVMSKVDNKNSKYQF
jgi:hypothetical protein